MVVRSVKNHSYSDDLLDRSRSPFFRPGVSKRAGRYIVTPTGRWFHGDVTCKKIRVNPDLAEVDIVEQAGRYYRAGKLTEVQECPTCQPIKKPAQKIEPLGTTDTPCAGRDREWVKSFHNRRPENLVPIQRECMGCDVLEECYSRFLFELPEYGVLGGVTIQQYKAWGPNALAMVKELVANENQEEKEPAQRPRPERRSRRIN